MTVDQGLLCLLFFPFLKTSILSQLSCSTSVYEYGVGVGAAIKFISVSVAKPLETPSRTDFSLSKYLEL